MRKMKAARDVVVSFPPKKLYVTITKDEFGWELDASFVKNEMGFIGSTAPTIWGVIDSLCDYINEELEQWASFDANERK